MRKKNQHPTIFVFDGEIRDFNKGSMLELHSQVTDREWEQIVEETIKYKIFVNCLKDVGCPKLNEPWTEEDEWYRLQLQVAVSRMRNIDPLLVSKNDEEAIYDAYSKQMINGADNMLKMIESVSKANKELIKEKYGLDDEGNVRVSKL